MRFSTTGENCNVLWYVSVDFDWIAQPCVFNLLVLVTVTAVLAELSCSDHGNSSLFLGSAQCKRDYICFHHAHQLQLTSVCCFPSAGGSCIILSTSRNRKKDLHNPSKYKPILYYLRSLHVIHHHVNSPFLSFAWTWPHSSCSCSGFRYTFKYEIFRLGLGAIFQPPSRTYKEMQLTKLYWHSKW